MCHEIFDFVKISFQKKKKNKENTTDLSIQCTTNNTLIFLNCKQFYVLD